MTYLEKLKKALENTPGIQNLGDYDPENLRLIEAKAQVEKMTPADLTPQEQAHLAAVEEMIQARSPVTEDGKPVMMKLSAWIAHDGPANANGDAFLGEDLEKVVAGGLFSPPHVGMVDFNHDFFPYGVWFSSSYELDPQAGQMGILVEGTLFAWRFPEMADKLLAEQARNGFVAVSMACIAKYIETKYNAETERQEYVLREPTFLTASFLDVAPADPNGRGGVSEDEESTHESRVEEINQALLNLFAASAEASATATTQEDEMDLEKIIEALREALGETASEHVAELKEALKDAAKVPALQDKIASLEAELETAKEELEAAQVEVEAKATALEAKATEMAELAASLEEVTAERDEMKAEKEAAELARVREERLEKLPKAYRTALDARDEEVREKMVARLVTLSDEDFDAEVETLSESFTTDKKPGLTELSKEEGLLPTPSGAGKGGYAIDKYMD